MDTSIEITPEQAAQMTPAQKDILIKAGFKLPLNKSLKPRFNDKLIKQLWCNECGDIEEQWFLVDKSCPQLHELQPVKDNVFSRDKAKIEKKMRTVCPKCPQFVDSMNIEELKTRLKNSYKLLFKMNMLAQKMTAKFKY